MHGGARKLPSFFLLWADRVARKPPLTRRNGRYGIPAGLDVERYTDSETLIVQYVLAKPVASIPGREENTYKPLLKMGK